MKKLNLCVCTLLLLANFLILVPLNAINEQSYNDTPYQTIIPLYDKPVREVVRE